MRIGTWNLAGRWGTHHHELLLGAECDVWLLTEVNDRVVLGGYRRHAGTAYMAERRRWVAVLSRVDPLPLADPHPASAAAIVGGMTFCASVLPWRSCGSRAPWDGEGHAGRVDSAVSRLLRVLPAERLVWGGDWNHGMSGRETAGSAAGRAHIAAALDRLRLQVPTARLPHRIEGLLSIDHIAVGVDVPVTAAERVRADGLSDHDAYVVETAG